MIRAQSSNNSSEAIKNRDRARILKHLKKVRVAAHRKRVPQQRKKLAAKMNVQVRKLTKREEFIKSDSEESTTNSSSCEASSEEESSSEESANEESSAVKEGECVYLNEKNRKIKEILKEDFPCYLRLLNLWFTNQLTKDEFDDLARDLLPRDEIMAHDEFIWELMKEIHSLSPPSTNQAYLYKEEDNDTRINIQNEQSGAGNKTDPQYDSQKVGNAAAAVKSKVHFQPAPEADYLPLQDKTFHEHRLLQDASVKSCFPDLETLYGLMFIQAWQNDLRVIDKRALHILLDASQIHIKRIITAVLMRRNNYKVRDSCFVHDFGEERVPQAFNGANIGEDLGPSLEKKPISVEDLLDAAKVYPEAFSLKSLHTLAVERMHMRLTSRDCNVLPPHCKSGE